MARILAYTSPARGHLYPLVPTLLELRARGHEVHVRTLTAEVAGLHREGLSAGPVAAAIEDLPLTDWQAVDPLEQLGLALGTLFERAEHEIPDLRAAIDELRPDALLVDIATAGAAALAETTSLPWAQWMPFLRLVHPYALPPGIEGVNKVRASVGLDPVTEPWDTWRAPLTLYYTAPPLEPADVELPPSFRVVGPGLWEPPAILPDWFDGLRDPLVLVSVSSEVQGDDELVGTALEALRDEDVRVVVTTVAHDPGRFEAPANATVGRWLPHGPVLRRASAVVCHGGMGITQKALAEGVPVCVVPFGRDQFEVADRVAGLGAGTRVLRDGLDPEALRKAVRAAMELRPGARGVAAELARAGGVRAAADAVEGLLGSDR